LYPNSNFHEQIPFIKSIPTQIIGALKNESFF
jgi:hypothetical protein